MDLIGIFLIILLIIGIFVTIQYNKLIKLKNNRENAFADIDVQLQTRFNLVENLVKTVKWYASHEQETFQKVTEARTNFLNSNTPDEKIESNNMLTWALKDLFAVSENYPDLKSNENFLQLQNELSDLENKIASARRYFNSATKEFNSYTEMFPSNIIANIFGFKQWKYFEIDNEEIKETPNVEF